MQDPSAVGRRRVVAASGVGIVSMALPAASVAASPAPEGGSSSGVSGGTVDTASVAGFTLHMFTTGGALVLDRSVDVQYLVVGGGGGGGNSTGGLARWAGGGGGGGEVLLSEDFATNQFVRLEPGTYPVEVGAGGAPGAPGGQSSFNALVARPGQGGGVPQFDGDPGGNGGASGSGNSGGSDNLGGQGVNANYAGGGGGGDSAAGDGGLWQAEAGSGGAGTEITGFTSSPTSYGGGGGGGVYNDDDFDGYVGNAAPVRGLGADGGGDGILLDDSAVPGAVLFEATAGAANRGGGGGGGSDGGGGKAGGSGIVIIRYETP